MIYRSMDEHKALSSLDRSAVGRRVCVTSIGSHELAGSEWSIRNCPFSCIGIIKNTKRYGTAKKDEGDAYNVLERTRGNFQWSQVRM